MSKIFRDVTIAGMTAMLFVACKPSQTNFDPLENATTLEKIEYYSALATKTKGDGNPALWKMSDDDTTIYMFGTIHTLPTDVEWRTSAFNSALSASDTIYLEGDLNEYSDPETMNALTEKYFKLKDGKTLKSILSKSEYVKVATVAETVGLDIEDYSSKPLWYFSEDLMYGQLKKIGYEMSSGVEMILIEEGTSAGKTFKYLERVEEQIKATDAGSIQDHVEQLMFTAEGLEALPGFADLTVSEWADGDIIGLGNMLHNGETMGGRAIYENLIVNRNRNWTGQIVEMLDEPGTIFLAGGIAHFVGPDSVISMLEAKGQKIEVVE